MKTPKPPKKVLWKGNQAFLEEAQEMAMTYLTWSLELGRDRDLGSISGGNLHAINGAITTAMREIERCENIIATKEQNRSESFFRVEYAKPGEDVDVNDDHEDMEA